MYTLLYSVIYITRMYTHSRTIHVNNCTHLAIATDALQRTESKLELKMNVATTITTM